LSTSRSEENEMMYAYRTIEQGIVDNLRNTHDLHVQHTPTPNYVTTFPVEGVTMSKQMQELLKEIRDSFARSMTQIKFFTLSVHVCSSVAIYREGDTFVLGYIGYDGDKYYVSHPSIKNEKYKDHSPNYRVITSSGKDHVVKAARRYCIPVTTADVCHAIPHKVSRDFQIAYMTNKKAMEEEQGRLSYSGLALDALCSVLRGETVSSTIMESVRKYEALKVDTAADLGARPRLTCFMFNQLKSGVTITYFRTLCVMKYSNSINNFMREAVTSPEDLRQYWTVAELPEEVMGKLSVLSMVENEQYIKGVGYRYLPSVYFLEMSPEMERAARVVCDV
jgi:hypothetical protein